MSAPFPIELRAPEGARRMEIEWSDGVATSYRHAVLRGFCPCAHCQGHHGPVAFVPGQGSPELRDIEEVGNYAVRLTWADGHATGIYTFAFLRELGALAEVADDALPGYRFGR